MVPGTERSEGQRGFCALLSPSRSEMARRECLVAGEDVVSGEGRGSESCSGLWKCWSGESPRRVVGSDHEPEHEVKENFPRHSLLFVDGPPCRQMVALPGRRSPSRNSTVAVRLSLTQPPAQFESVSGHGQSGSCCVTLELGATPRWMAGSIGGGLEDRGSRCGDQKAMIGGRCENGPGPHFPPQRTLPLSLLACGARGLLAAWMGPWGFCRKEAGRRRALGCQNET